MGKIFEGWFTLTHTYLTSSEMTALPLPVLLRYCKVMLLPCRFARNKSWQLMVKAKSQGPLHPALLLKDIITLC